MGKGGWGWLRPFTEFHTTFHEKQESIVLIRIFSQEDHRFRQVEGRKEQIRPNFQVGWREYSGNRRTIGQNLIRV